MKEKIIDAYDLRNAYYKHHPNGHFFDSDTLRFFGESLSSMRLLKHLAKVKDYSGVEHLCYILSTSQKDWNGKRYRKHHYFDVETFDDIIPNL